MKEPRLTPELKCNDYEASLNFYQDILGFEILFKRETHGFAMMDFEGSRIMIDRDDQYFKDLHTDTQRPYGRGVNLQIQTNDVVRLYEKVKNFNCPVAYELEDAWYKADDIEAGNKQFCVQDPDGYLLRFFEDLGERPYKNDK